MPKVPVKNDGRLPADKNQKAAQISTVKQAAKKAAKKTAKPPKIEPDLVYDHLHSEVYGPDNPITEDMAKDWLGWEELPEDHKGDYLLKDREGLRIICKNNKKNRPYTPNLAHLYCQEILRKQWQVNGETIIIGCYGQILAGQHRFIGLILACQMWREEPESYPQWEEQPTLQSFVSFGVSEEDKVVNTIDTGKPRTLSDAVFRSELFSSWSPPQRKNVSKILDFAVRTLWFRTGLGTAAHAPRRTHSEAFDFITAHETLLKCVKHISEENSENKIGRFISPGTAAALMYMMACSGSDCEEYKSSESRHEHYLNFSLYDQAEAFWVNLASGSKLIEPLKRAFADMIENYEGGSPTERIALVVKAWDSFATHGKVLERDLKLEYHTNDEGRKVLMECPSIGGIDLGNPADHEEGQEVTPEQIELEKAAIKAEKSGKPVQKDKGKKKKATTVYLTPTDLKIGDKVWVQDGEEESSRWQGVYESHYKLAAGPIAKVRVVDGYAGTGKVFDVSFESLSLVE